MIKLAFVETFIAVFAATLMSQICVWLIDRYIKKHLNKIADKADNHIEIMKEKIKKEREGEFI